MDKQSPPYTVTILYANDKAFRDTICGDIVNLSYYEEVAKLGIPGHVAFNLEEQEAIYSHCQNRDKHWNEEKPFLKTYKNLVTTVFGLISVSTRLLPKSYDSESLTISPQT